MKEFTICYTFDNNIITEKIIKKSDVYKEDIEKDIIERMVEHHKYFIVENDQGKFMINTCLVRFVRITDEKILVTI